jgi:GNAT superfamily N-acetyltransferase
VTDVQPLARSHDREAFDCGSEAINTFLRTTARQHQDRGISRTFVLVDPDSESRTRILGFFTLSACEGVSADLPSPLAKRFPRSLPAVLLGRLAVDREFQGRGFGGALLIEAICRVAALSTQIGIAGLFVDAKTNMLRRSASDSVSCRSPVTRAACSCRWRPFCAWPP